MIIFIGFLIGIIAFLMFALKAKGDEIKSLEEQLYNARIKNNELVCSPNLNQHAKDDNNKQSDCICNITLLLEDVCDDFDEDAEQTKEGSDVKPE